MKIILTDNNAPGSTNVRDAVKFDYSPLWQVTDFTQEPVGDITTSSVKASYQYATLHADASSSSAPGNYSRPSKLIYPNGDHIEFGYGTSGSVDDRISRILSIDSANHVGG